MFPLLIVYLFLVGVGGEIHIHQGPKLLLWYGFCAVVLLQYADDIRNSDKTRATMMLIYEGMILTVTVAGLATALIGDL
jgi:hypothetical protein